MLSFIQLGVRPVTLHYALHIYRPNEGSKPDNWKKVSCRLDVVVMCKHKRMSCVTVYTFMKGSL